jgi:hypothetical protein
MKVQAAIYYIDFPKSTSALHFVESNRSAFIDTKNDKRVWLPLNAPQSVIEKLLGGDIPLPSEARVERQIVEFEVTPIDG